MKGLLEYVVGTYRKPATSCEAKAMSFVKLNGLGALEPDNYLSRLGMPELYESKETMGSIFGNGLADVPPPPPSLYNALTAFLSPPSPTLSGDVANMFSAPPPWERTNALTDASTNPRPLYTNRLPTLADAFLKVETKRKAYFAFRFEDIMRVNNVRNGGKINHPDSMYMRSFFDRSIWGKSKAKEPDSLKSLMRDAVVQSSAICVLVGAHTWQGRWVKYEIARSVIDQRGLLAVHINGIKQIERLTADARGLSPLHFMGIFHDPNGFYYLYENFLEFNATTGLVVLAWRPYQDFTGPVPLPRYIPSIEQGVVMPLARYTQEYDYIADVGNKNIGAWIDKAAIAVGR